MDFLRSTTTSVAVVIPARNAAQTLPECLAAIRRSSIPVAEIIVFDDASTDQTPLIAEQSGARVIRNEGRCVGPAAARNRAAKTVTAEVIAFVDADVVIHPDAVERLVAAMRANPGLAAAFGSYDDASPARRLSGQYTNLRHHHIHQSGERDASTFWSGLGAVRRSDYEKVGGFDVRYERPCIEDIEFGWRLRQAGRQIALVPEAQGAHQKDWSLTQTWRTDIFHRAIPWATLIASGRSAPVLNANGEEVVKASFAHLVWVCLLFSAINPAFLILTAAAAAAYLGLNASFMALLHAKGGKRLLLTGAAMHWCYHLYASAVFASVQAANRLGIVKVQPAVPAPAKV